MAGDIVNSPEAKILSIGDNLGDLRKKKKFSLEDLVAATGLDKNTLSQIENNIIVPPVAALMKLSKALNTHLAYFFQDKAGTEKISVTRNNERVRIEKRPHHHKGEVNYRYEALETKKINKHMEPFLVKFDVRTREEIPLQQHRGEEFLHLMEGKLEFFTKDETIILEEGDSIYFDSGVPHGYRGIGKESPKALVVVYSP